MNSLTMNLFVPKEKSLILIKEQKFSATTGVLVSSWGAAFLPRGVQQY